jgi:hypothetical protein
MLERWETYDKHGVVSGYLLKERSPGRSSSMGTRRSGTADSHVVHMVCQIVGLMMLMALVVLFWLLVMNP